MKRIKNYQNQIRNLEWQIDKILSKTASDIALNFNACLNILCDARIFLGMQTLRIKQRSESEQLMYKEWHLRGWTLRVYVDFSPEDLNSLYIENWFKDVLNTYLKDVVEA